MKTYLSFSRRDVILPSSSTHKRAQSEEEKCELPDKCELINDVQESIESGKVEEKIEVIAILGNALSRKVNLTLSFQLGWH